MFGSDTPAAQYLSIPHLLGMEGMTPPDIRLLLDRADQYADWNRNQCQQAEEQTVSQALQALKGKTQINIFFENSTRTLVSFELAGKKLGMTVLNMAVSHSSVKKGESLIDTAATLNAMRPDILVMRHESSGAVDLLAQKVACVVINAGDGQHEHPTQALLDALTIRRRRNTLHGLVIAICGDVVHSRVARSNIHLLNTCGARVRLVGPPTFVPDTLCDMGVEIFHSMEQGLKDCDVIMMLRVQKERMQAVSIPSIREYYHFYGLDRDKLARAKPDAIIMHPGPINRGVEISTEVADDVHRSVITEQVEMGVAVRMACLDLLLNKETSQGWLAGLGPDGRPVPEGGT